MRHVHDVDAGPTASPAAASATAAQGSTDAYFIRQLDYCLVDMKLLPVP